MGPRQNLVIQIRLARHALGEDPHAPIRGTVAQLRELLRELRERQKAEA